MLDDTSALPRAFRVTISVAQGILDAAIAEIEMLAEEGPAADEPGVDTELWEHVAPEIRSEAWGKAAREAVIFTEDRIRRWAGRLATEVGKDLAVAVFGVAGNYKMGLTPGEEQGWQFLAQGIAQALRNADTHRIQERSDHKRYTMGVIAHARCCSPKCDTCMGTVSATRVRRCPTQTTPRTVELQASQSLRNHGRI
jgi:hypothetical protein